MVVAMSATAERPATLPPADITIVPLAESHEDAIKWVLSSWLGSWETQRPRIYGQLFPPTKAQYMKCHRTLITGLVERGCWVAHESGAPDLFRGWLCGGSRVLHYVYTRQRYRRRGIARALMGSRYDLERPPAYSHQPRFREGVAFAQAMKLKRHRSYLLWQGKEDEGER